MIRRLGRATVKYTVVATGMAIAIPACFVASLYLISVFYWATH